MARFSSLEGAPWPIVILGSALVLALAGAGLLMFVAAVTRWRSRPAHAPADKGRTASELENLFEDFRSDRTVVHACVEDTASKVFTVHMVPKPQLTREKARRYEELAGQIRAEGWRVDGTPSVIEVLCGTQYPYIQDEHPSAGRETQIHLGRVCVRNRLVDAIESVEVSLIDVSVVASGSILPLTGLPAKLILMNDRPSYQASFLLGGEAEQYLDLLTAHLGSGDMFVQHIVPGVDVKLRSSDGPFLFRVRVTGRELPRVEEVFKVGVAARCLYIRR